MSDVGRYRKLYARLWRHPGFSALNDGEKVLAIYLLTGPQTNRLGLYCLSIATAAEDLGTVPETIKKRLVNVCQTFGWLFDGRSRVFYIPSWFKWNPPENVNVMKGSLKDLNEIPPCALVETFSRNIETVPETLHQTFLEGLRQRLPKGVSNQEPYPYQDQKQELKPSALRAVAANDNGSSLPDSRLGPIASRVVNESPKTVNLDYLIDAVIHECQLSGLKNCTRKQAIAALGSVGVKVA